MLGMSARPTNPKIFVAGANGIIGAAVIQALLEAGAQVTALVPPGIQPRFTATERLTWVQGDVWNRGSLIKRSRGHRAVIHLVGSIRQNPARGQTYHYLNVDSLQNVTRMAIGDGVPRLLFLSAAGAPWLPGNYVRSKREAEDYLGRSGIPHAIIRAPLAYPHGQLHNPLLLLFVGIASIPLLGRPATRWAPLPVDVIGRGIARLALMSEMPAGILYGRHLRRLSQEMARYRGAGGGPAPDTPPTLIQVAPPPDHDIPFGWLP